MKSRTKRWSRWSGDIDLLVRRLCEFHMLILVNAAITYAMASEVIEVPENSENAKRWPRWIEPVAEGSSTPLTLAYAIAGPSTQPSVTTKTLNEQASSKQEAPQNLVVLIFICSPIERTSYQH